MIASIKGAILLIIVAILFFITNALNIQTEFKFYIHLTLAILISIFLILALSGEEKPTEKMLRY